jgi:hypothetical protein
VFDSFQRVAHCDMNDFLEKEPGVQDLACRLGSLKNGIHKLNLELRAPITEQLSYNLP